jgi:phosphatidylinositol kinase/protein kinase (PI-3  family)
LNDSQHSEYWLRYVAFSKKLSRIHNFKNQDLLPWIQASDGIALDICAPIDRFLCLKHVITDEAHFISLYKMLPFYDVMKSLQKPVKLWFNCQDGSRIPLLFKYNDEIRKDNRVLDYLSHFVLLKKNISFKKGMRVNDSSNSASIVFCHTALGKFRNH